MAEPPEGPSRDLLRAVFLGCAMLACCAGEPAQQRVQAKYDTSGQLSELTLHAGLDGKPNVISYLKGNKFLRIEIDANEDGKVDRWEYYSDEQKLEKVGLSRAGDGKADSWAYQAADGSLQRLETSTRNDGSLNRTEYYERGALARAEEDTDGDGRVDKWERYESGALVSVSFDVAKSGKPTTTIEYRRP